VSDVLGRSEAFRRGGDEAVCCIDVADLDGAADLVFTVHHTEGDSKLWEVLGSLRLSASGSQAYMRVSGIRSTLRYEVSSTGGPIAGRSPSFRLHEPIWLAKRPPPSSNRAPGTQESPPPANRGTDEPRETGPNGQERNR